MSFSNFFFSKNIGLFQLLTIEILTKRLLTTSLVFEQPGPVCIKPWNFSSIRQPVVAAFIQNQYPIEEDSGGRGSDGTSWAVAF